MERAEEMTKTDTTKTVQKYKKLLLNIPHHNVTYQKH